MTTSAQRRLSTIFKQLSPSDQYALLAFAEFLQSRTVVPPPSFEIQAILRPPEESVIAAIKRLSQTYPMLDKDKLLGETSALMSEHILRGRDKVEVIDELEALFLRHYQIFVHEHEKK